MLVDIFSENLIKATFSESEFPTIYEEAFGSYIIDESQMFRYAKRHKSDGRIKRFIQGNIRTDNFKDVWDNKYREFRNKDRTKCEECGKCEQWEYCLGGAFHTWNFTDNEQNKCTYNMINEK